MTYKLVNDIKESSVLTCIYNKTENKYIPLDTNNRDYQAYLAWVAEGNTAEAAD